MTWQTIETAPKDGTRIIIATKSHSDGVALVQYEPNVPSPCFMDDDGDSYFDATHWQPLPTPPVSSSTG